MRLSLCTLRVLQENEDEPVCDFLKEVDNVILEYTRCIPKFFVDGTLLIAKWDCGLELIQ